MLGVVDQMMCDTLRERVFYDIGRPELKERCLEVIKKLELEKNVLSEEDREELKRVEHN